MPIRSAQFTFLGRVKSTSSNINVLSLDLQIAAAAISSLSFGYAEESRA